MTANLEKALEYQITHNSGVIALISTRTTPVNLPQTVILPAATYQLVSGVPTKHHAEVSTLPRQRVQITCWSLQVSDVVAVDLAIKAALDGKRGNWGVSPLVTFIESCQAETTPRDDRDSVTGIYQRFRDYFIMWKE